MLNRHSGVLSPGRIGRRSDRQGSSRSWPPTSIFPPFRLHAPVSGSAHNTLRCTALARCIPLAPTSHLCALCYDMDSTANNNLPLVLCFDDTASERGGDNTNAL